MNLPIQYYPNFVADPDSMFKQLRDELAWVRRDTTPRSEYYYNSWNVPYTYGRGRGIREYQPQPSHPIIEGLIAGLYTVTPGAMFDVCFLNRYHDQSDQLGWHSDNSPEMDDTKPIAILSLGAERDIMFSKKDENEKPIGNPVRLKLENGSLCLMAAGMQDTHLHRIPKASFICGERISLTFRGYVKS